MESEHAARLAAIPRLVKAPLVELLLIRRRRCRCTRPSEQNLDQRRRILIVAERESYEEDEEGAEANLLGCWRVLG